MECLIRLFPRKLRQNYATKFIDDNTIRDGFLSIKDREFETVSIVLKPIPVINQISSHMLRS